MSRREHALYLTEHVRCCERRALDDPGMTEKELMLRAGMAAFHTLKTHYPEVRTIAVFCGGGNNAGDAYVLARLAHGQGFSVVIYSYKAIDDLPLAAKEAAWAAISDGVCCHPLDDEIDAEIELIVDGLLGVGLQGAVRDPIAHAIQLINESGLPVLALDIPSGLDADTGCVRGVCVHAAVTTTFIAEKMGLYLLDGPDHCGKIVCHPLYLEQGVAALTPGAYRLADDVFQGVISPRIRNSHKGMYGHVLIIGGGPGMPGAVYLAACAALRVGAGVVTVATLAEHAGRVVPQLPEAMIYAIDGVADLLPLLAKATVVVLGPGLGESAWANELFKAAIGAPVPLVMDASALRMLANHPQYDDHWVLTPHPGEAAGLLACSVSEIQMDRCKAASLIQQHYGGCVVLKGVGSVVCTEERETYICTAGNAGMASAGMGDVLSGVIGGLLAQGLSLADAATFGVWLHARAADDAVHSQGERGLIASDLMPFLRRQMNLRI